MTTASLTAEDLARVGLDPATETILTAEETNAIGRAFAGWLGIGQRGVIVFPFTSLQPLPRPRKATPDGRGRLPPGITAEGSRHPAWWLDAHTAWQDPAEGDLAYGVRLALELERRGVSVPGDGPIDALASGLGWPLGDPATDARVAAYAAGGWNPELCRFELHRATNSGAAPRADVQRRARQLLAPRLALIEVLRARRSACDRAALNAELGLVDRLEEALDRLIEQIRRDGDQLCRRARHHDDRNRLLPARQALASSVESLTAALNDLDDASRRHQAHRDSPVDPERRRREAAVLIGAVYADPEDDAPYRALHGQLEAWRVAGTQTADASREAIDNLLRSPDGDDLRSKGAGGDGSPLPPR